MQAYLISCDPGKNKHALAVFDSAKTLREVTTCGRFAEFDRICEMLVLELPQVYPGQLQKGDPNDLISLAFAAGELSGGCRWKDRILVLPHQWKGQVSKPICHHRIWQVLEQKERDLFPADTESRIQIGLDGGPYSAAVHNSLDAVGIGLFALQRFFQ